MKWICIKCKSSNAQGANLCHKCGSDPYAAAVQEIDCLRKLALAADDLLAVMGTKEHPIEEWHGAQFEELEMRAADYWGKFPYAERRSDA